MTISGNTETITTYATYTDDGNHISSVTDARGNVTSYGYDSDTGTLLWVQAPGETEDTRTEYTYDSLYRKTKVEDKLSNETSSVNTYTYTDDLLTQSTSAGGTVYTYNHGLFDLVESVNVGNRNLISHEYDNDDLNGTIIPKWYLTKSTYGNDDFITYSYDQLGRTTGIGYEDNANAIQYKFDNDCNVGVVIDNMNNLMTKYYYDTEGRLMGYDEQGTEREVTVMWGYDDFNNVNAQNIIINGITYAENYTYDKDHRLIESTAGSVVSAYVYDELSRLTGIINRNNTSNVVATTIAFTESSSLIYQWTNTTATSTTYTYEYDNRGNITSISDGTHTTTYVYDQQDQLIRENNQEADKTWVYEYDTAGNILSKTEYTYTTGDLGTAIDTIEYKYTDETWHELLTEYDGQEITYDDIGNMTSDGTWSYTWKHGRQLATATDGTTSVSYEYNADGMRLSKTVGSTTTKYYYVGSQLVEMSHGSEKLHFTYDVTGVSTVTYNGAIYYYLKNAQGDILGIVDDSGAEVVSYTYDAWGNILSVTGSMASTLGMLNPLRYRGYVYDEETNLYYLQTRYYSPVMGWFISADIFTDIGRDVQDTNMYAYCLNNPVMLSDPSGLCAVFPYPNIFPFAPVWDIGTIIIEELKKKKEEQQEYIDNGTVSYISRGSKQGAHIENSYLIWFPDLMYEYIESNKTDDIQGSTQGAVFEWQIHNIAYLLFSALGNSSMQGKAKHVDLGNTIYDDKRYTASESIMSFLMKLAYELSYPGYAQEDFNIYKKGLLKDEKQSLKKVF